MRNFHVYGIGAALVDTEIEVSDADLSALGVDKGMMTLVDETRQQALIDHLHHHITLSRRASGGSAANTVIAVSAFGGKTFYSCKVADDENGRFYLNDLAAVGVTHPGDHLLPPGTTGKCLVLITPDAERSMNTFLGISETLSVDNLDAVAIGDSEYIYIEGYLATSPSGRAAAIKARELAQASGTRTALSLSDPGMVAHFRDGLEQMLGDGVDLLFCNRDEALAWTGTRSLDEAAEAIAASARTFAITLGGDGALVCDGSRLHHIDPCPVTAVDTNGAGDMFAGAFLYGITQGFDFPRAGRLASIAAATVVTQYGPRLPLAKHQDVLRTFQNHGKNA